MTDMLETKKYTFTVWESDSSGTSESFDPGILLYATHGCNAGKEWSLRRKSLPQD